MSERLPTLFITGRAGLGSINMSTGGKSAWSDCGKRILGTEADTLAAYRYDLRGLGAIPGC